jgi:alpha-tubulin suppressor-like RCC1 family protein
MPNRVGWAATVFILHPLRMVAPVLCGVALLLSACGGEKKTTNNNTTTVGSEGETAATGPAGCYASDPLLDTDGDGLTNCDEINYFGTSSLLKDTDGDGLSDFDEIVDFGFSPYNNNFKFNPRIADVPKISIRFTSAPDIALLYNSSTGVEQTHQVTRSVESAQTVTSSSSESNSLAVTASHTAGASLTVGSEAGVSVGLFGGVSAGVSVEATVSYDFSRSTSNERSFSFSDEQAKENRQGMESAQALASIQTTQVHGGRLSLTLDVGNTGLLSFTLSELVLSAYIAAPDSGAILQPLGTLTISGGIPELTYGPNQFSGPFVFETDDLDVDSARALALNTNGLVLRVAGYELVDENGKAFNHNLTAINAKTATVILDYGEANGRGIERYMVATNTDPAVLRITAAKAMSDVLGLVKDGSTALKSYTTGAGGVLTSVRGVAADPATTSFWMALHKQSDGVTETIVNYDATVAPYDYDALELKSGDVLHLVYYSDPDGDGLENRQERSVGSDIAVADSDGDGLLDGEEMFTYRTSPVNIESDGDGYPDGWEVAAGTDPANRLSTPADRVAAGGFFGASLSPSGTLRTWGNDLQGQLGRSYAANACGTCTPDPGEPAPGEVFISIATGYDFTVAIRADGTLWSWGTNDSGALGRTGDNTVPGQVGTATNWAALAGGTGLADEGHILAIRADGTLWSWGWNFFGALGRASADTCITGSCGKTPGQVGTDTDWVTVTRGYDFSIALKADGTLWSWGNSALGRTPTAGSPANRPGQVGTARDWANISAGNGVNLAVKRNGTLWTTNAPLTQVGTDTDWVAVAAGRGPAFQLALKRNGTLWSWGSAGVFLGRGGAAGSPGQVGSDTDWLAVSAGSEGHVQALKGDRLTYSWGLSLAGKLGRSGGDTDVPGQVLNP